jgi:hypothetical protein
MRKIDQLRRDFPDLKWTYEWPSIWKNDAGWQVQGFSCVSIGPSGGETYYTEYRRSDNGQWVILI